MMRTTTTLARLLLCVLLPAAFAEPATAAEPTETWDQMFIDGQPAGSVHTIVERLETDEGVHVRTVAVTEMKMKRMGATTEINSRSESWEREDGTLVRIAQTTRQSAQVTDQVFAFGDGKVSIRTTLMGKTREVEQPLEGRIIGPHAQNGLTAALAGTKDQSVTFTAYVPDFQRAVKTTLTSGGAEAVELLDGARGELTRVDVRLDGLPMRPVSWLDAEGRTLKTSVSLVGMKFDTYRRAGAPTADDPGEAAGDGAPEVFNATLLSEDDPIPVPRKLEAATIVVRKRAPDVELPDMSAVGHAVETRADGSLEIRAGRAVPPTGRRGMRPLAEPAAELADALAGSSMVQSDDEQITKLAARLVGGEHSAWRAAQTLERWVYENMTKKSMNVAFASALESLQTREGDCTEHAVLLAALCRAAGIPARVVMGLEYLMGIWGGHAWNEVWIEGTWYPLDATNGYGFVDPLHLPMAHMTLKEGGASEFTALLMGIGNMDVDIVSVTRAGRRIDLDAPAAAVTARYRNPVWGLEAVAPTGWTVKPAGPARTPSPRLVAFETKSEDGDVRILVDAVDVPPAPAGEADPLAAFVRAAKLSANKGSVDGRPSLSATVTRGETTRRVVFCIAKDALYVFSLAGPADESQRAAFDALLGSVDFDVR